jgi:hypothetical protein
LTRRAQGRLSEHIKDPLLWVAVISSFIVNWMMSKDVDVRVASCAFDPLFTNPVASSGGDVE